MLLLPFTGFWVSVSEDKVDFIGAPALVRAEHDGEGGLESARRS
jgi:hypothetical protein